MTIEYKGSHYINGAYVEDTNGKPIDLIYPATRAAAGRLYEATHVGDDMTIAREEIFGPVASILIFDDEGEVIGRANDTSFGLSGAVFTDNLACAHPVAARLEVGRAWINCYNFSPVEVPFGGVKDSGIGRECAMAALDHFTQIKSIVVETGPIACVF